MATEQPYHIRIFHNHGSVYITDPEGLEAEGVLLEEWLGDEFADGYDFLSMDEVSTPVNSEHLSHGIRVMTRHTEMLATEE